MPKVPYIAGENTEAKLKGCGGNQQVLKTDRHALLRSSPFDAAGNYAGFKRHRINRQIANQFVSRPMITSESRINPTRAELTVCDCE